MQGGGQLHLRVKDTSIRLHNTDSLIESLHCVCCACLIGDYGRQVELQVLWLQLCRKAVANAFLLTTWNFNIVSRSGKIANDCRCLTTKTRSPEVASDEDHGDGVRLFVADGKESLSWVAIYELDAKDLRGRE